MGIRLQLRMWWMSRPRWGDGGLIWAEAVTDTGTPRKSVFLQAKSYQHGRAHSDLPYLLLGILGLLSRAIGPCVV